MESETKLNKAEHDKEKLEIFAKRSLTNFKEKYMAALQRYKSEKNALEVKYVNGWMGMDGCICEVCARCHCVGVGAGLQIAGHGGQAREGAGTVSQRREADVISGI